MLEMRFTRLVIDVGLKLEEGQGGLLERKFSAISKLLLRQKPQA